PIRLHLDRARSLAALGRAGDARAEAKRALDAATREDIPWIVDDARALLGMRAITAPQVRPQPEDLQEAIAAPKPEGARKPIAAPKPEGPRPIVPSKPPAPQRRIAAPKPKDPQKAIAQPEPEAQPKPGAQKSIAPPI